MRTVTLKAAIDGGKTYIMLNDGEYDIAAVGACRNAVSFVGASKNAVLKMEETGIYPEGAELTFKNLTISIAQLGYGSNENTYGAMFRTDALTIDNCNINGCLCLCGNGTTNITNTAFTNTFSSGFNGYGIFYYGYNDSVVNISDCTFDMVSKAIVIYNHSTAVNTFKYTLNVSDCKFKASDSATDKAAIQMHTEQGSVYGTVKINDCTATGYLDKNNGLWNEVNNYNQTETFKFDIYVDDVLVHAAQN